MNYQTIQLDPNSLQGHPRNYREHPEDQIEHIVQSIEEHGFYRNIVLSKDHVILAGHGVVKASRRMQLETIPCIVLDIDHEHPKALKVLAGDNEIAHLGVINDIALSEILKEINEFDDMGLIGTGYDEMMLANLLYITRPASEIATIDEAAEWVGMPDIGDGKAEEADSKCIVNFASPSDRAAFFDALDLPQGFNLKTIWYPFRPRRDMKSVRHEEVATDDKS